MPLAPVATVGSEELGTDYDKYELVEQSMEDDTQQKRLKPGDSRVVTINGHTVTLVIGREYEFKLKPGAANAPAKAAKKSTAKNTADKKVAAKAGKPVESSTPQQ